MQVGPRAQEARLHRQEIESDVTSLARVGVRTAPDN